MGAAFLWVGLAALWFVLGLRRHAPRPWLPHLDAIHSGRKYSSVVTGPFPVGASHCPGLQRLVTLTLLPHAIPHSPLPSHKPFGPTSQSLFGAVEASMGAQVPSGFPVNDEEHAIHGLSQIESQHTSSTQNPEPKWTSRTEWTWTAQPRSILLVAQPAAHIER